ncbi:MAG: Tfp pilus assembly protein FimT/FimU, partial [Gemmatimonadota bacterium]
MAGSGRGFTIVELLMVIIVATVLLAIAYGGYRQFNEAAVVRKAAVLVGSDVGLARTLAIRQRGNVSLVAEETGRTYQIRDTGGAVLARRTFDPAAALPLDVLDVQTAGDSLTFNSR